MQNSFVFKTTMRVFLGLDAGAPSKPQDKNALADVLDVENYVA